MALSNEEKIEIIHQHLKNVEYNVYNITISILEENSRNIARCIRLETCKPSMFFSRVAINECKIS